MFARSVNGPPELTCHCTVGVGSPLAAAVKLTLAAPYVTTWFVGWVVTDGAVHAGVTSVLVTALLFPGTGSVGDVAATDAVLEIDPDADDETVATIVMNEDAPAFRVA